MNKTYSYQLIILFRWWEPARVLPEIKGKKVFFLFFLYYTCFSGESLICDGCMDRYLCSRSQGSFTGVTWSMRAPKFPEISPDLQSYPFMEISQYSPITPLSTQQKDQQANWFCSCSWIRYQRHIVYRHWMFTGEQWQPYQRDITLRYTTWNPRLNSNASVLLERKSWLFFLWQELQMWVLFQNKLSVTYSYKLQKAFSSY